MEKYPFNSSTLMKFDRKKNLFFEKRMDSLNKGQPQNCSIRQLIYLNPIWLFSLLGILIGSGGLGAESSVPLGGKYPSPYKFYYRFKGELIEQAEGLMREGYKPSGQYTQWFITEYCKKIEMDKAFTLI